MANIKSSAKRDLIGKARNARNKADKSALKTTLKKFDEAVAQGDSEATVATHNAAVKAVDSAAGKGLIHKNKAARKKSQMARKLNTTAQAE